MVVLQVGCAVEEEGVEAEVDVGDMVVTGVETKLVEATGVELEAMLEVTCMEVMDKEECTDQVGMAKTTMLHSTTMEAMVVDMVAMTNLLMDNRVLGVLVDVVVVGVAEDIALTNPVSI